MPLMSEPEQWVWDIAKAIFDTKVKEAEPYPEAWKIWIGEIAWHRARLHARYPAVVGRSEYQPDGSMIQVSQRGEFTPDHIFGIPAACDKKGPPTQWRLVHADGHTLAWGECT